jgi:hypothetical protein
MKIKDIDKSLYRQRLNRVIIGFITTLAVLSLVFGSILIAMFSEPILEVAISAGEEQVSNFKYNFMGVLLSLFSCALILHRVKNTALFEEIYYVWQLKQIHNLIYRKLKKIKMLAFVDNDINAMIVLNYYYITLKQVYLLDDNTLTISALNKEQQKLEDLKLSKNITIDIEQFNKDMIASF